MLRLSEMCCLDGCEEPSFHVHSHIIKTTRYSYCTTQHQIQALRKQRLSASAYREPVDA